MKLGYTRNAPGYTVRDAEPDQLQIAPQIIMHNGAPIGIVPAREMILATIETGGGMVPAVLMVVPGAALAYSVSPEDLRAFAGRMIDVADKFESEAADAAAAALRRAAGK